MKGTSPQDLLKDSNDASFPAKVGEGVQRDEDLEKLSGLSILPLFRKIQRLLLPIKDNCGTIKYS